MTITVTLPDGSKKEVPRGTTPLDVAKSISPRLADAALVAKIKPKADPSTRANALAQDDKGTDGGKTPASIHPQQSKDGWQI